MLSTSSNVYGIKPTMITNGKQFQSVVEDMLCFSCLEVVLKPVECSKCHSILCEDCNEILTLAGKGCMTPKCGGSIKKANKFIREALSAMSIKCEFCNANTKDYQDYTVHVEKCVEYNSNPVCKLLKQINDKDGIIIELEQAIKAEKLKSQNIPSNLSKEQLRIKLITTNLPVFSKMEMYNACVEGKTDEFKKLIEKKNYPMLEEISAKSYYWTSLHYAMHYGQIDIIMYICDQLNKSGMLGLAMKLEANDGRCPMLCILRSNSINIEKKSLILTKLFNTYDITMSTDVKKELTSRNMLSVLATRR